MRTSRSLRYPLHYSDLEACFDARLRVRRGCTCSSRRGRSATRPPRSVPARESIRSARAAYDPENVPPGYRLLHGPLPEGTRVVQIRVYAAPATALSAAGLERKRLREIVERQLARLGDPHLAEVRWWLALRLCGNEREVECRCRKWTGLRPEDEQRMRVPLDAV